VLFKHGEYHNAMTLFQEAAEKEPSDHEVQFHLGMTHYMLGEEDPARLAFEQVVASSPDLAAREEARRRLAVMDIDPATAGPAAQSDLEARVRADPNDPVARVRLAAIQGRKGGSGDAAAGFEAALKLKPRDVGVMLELVKLYTGALHNPARARELAKNAHESAPDDPKISALLGHVLYQNGDYAWSLDLLQQAARDMPDQPELAYDLARSDYGVGKVAEAEEKLKGLAQGSAPAAIQASAGHLASMIAAAGSPAQARASLGEATKILEADPGDIPATIVVALSDESQGNFQEALRLYEKVSPDSAPFAPAVRRLALLYTWRLSDDKKALDLVSRARTAYPDDPELSGALGVLDYRRADYSAAVRLLQESLRARGDDPETLYYLGMTHYQLKDVSDSQDELKRAMDLKLPGAEAGEAMRALDEMNGTAKAPSLSDIPTN
jgi:Flp pilus assembly protein TadD